MVRFHARKVQKSVIPEHLCQPGQMVLASALKVTRKGSRVSHEQTMAKGFVVRSEKAMILHLMMVQTMTQHVMTVHMTGHRTAVRVTTAHMTIEFDQGCQEATTNQYLVEKWA